MYVKIPERIGRMIDVGKRFVAMQEMRFVIEANVYTRVDFLLPVLLGVQRQCAGQRQAKYECFPEIHIAKITDWAITAG
jgi:hypothetical protein